MTRAVGAVERVLAVVEEREPVVRAWAHLDPELAASDAHRVDASASRLPLAGMVLGVKDIFDTAEMPTEYGSVIYRGHRPRADAATVAMLRSAGAVSLGKTVTAELALFTPGATTNPHRHTHTPGGSSSGSAAAVAAGMADIALGTQTAGSVIRPASYCGVYGFKPSFGTVPVAGVKLVAPSLDTVGWFANSVADLDAVRVVLTGRSPCVPLARPPRLGILRDETTDGADQDSQAAVERAAHLARVAGADVVDVGLPPSVSGLAARQPMVQAYEAARSLSWERLYRPELLSRPLRDLLDWGQAIEPAQYDAVLGDAAGARRELAGLFHGIDALVSPASGGEAPADLNTTGDPRFNRLWTLLHTPAVNVPGLTGTTGLPVGIQLVGPPRKDAALLACAEWVGALLRYT
jgi:Asp-tRNA(Asn)/Glu-tRNA(Gln) amidotransferase A subunit family amidase